QDFNLFISNKHNINDCTQHVTIIEPIKVNKSRRHAIVFDAGSTGTRIHVFEFSEGHSLPSDLLLETEHFNQVKPGLSSYNAKPYQAVLSLIPLLKVANLVIPKQERHQTPILLKATAGLRLLKMHEANSIITTVDDFLRRLQPSYKFEENAISILDGESEGIYAWLTINFLLNTVDSRKSSAVLDLGGGSTQVTFAPLKNETFVYFGDRISSRFLLGSQKQLYAKSYLGFGLMSARKGILNTIDAKNDYSNDRMSFAHPCFKNGTNVVWRFENVDYEINGDDNGNCFDVVRKFVDLGENFNGINSPSEVKERTVYAISYYFDRALDIGLIDEKQSVGSVSVGDYYIAARVICQQRVDETEFEQFCSEVNAITCDKNWFRNVRNRIQTIIVQNPFICMDLSYIWTFLQIGLKFDFDKKIILVNKIDNVAISWALGAAFSLLHS
ncbi:ectonucleoside triphosphate diphosphohydrolase 5-like protein, partial [Dinothrombium tinctorium]